VVISIIALLIGVLLPALGRSRDVARRVKCQVNMRSIGTSLQMYMDTEGKGLYLPKVRPINDGGNENDPTLMAVMEKYITSAMPFRNSELEDWTVSDPFRCPSDLGGYGEVGQSDKPAWAQIGWSYRYFPGELMVAAELITVRNPHFGVSKAYEAQGNRAFILTDYDDWHHPRWKNIALDTDMTEEGKWNRNGLFYGDWHTAPAKFVNEETGRDFFADVIKFGGGLGG